MFVSKDLPMSKDGGFVIMEITGEAAFEEVTFHEEAVFDGARMVGLAKLSEVRFRKGASFKGVRFDRAIVSSARFEAPADFTDASFLELSLGGARFLKGVSFKGARFGWATLRGFDSSSADFSDTEFFDRLEIWSERVGGEISFEGATFHMGADIRIRSLEGRLILDGVNSGKSIKLAGIPRERVSRAGAKVLGGIRFVPW